MGNNKTNLALHLIEVKNRLKLVIIFHWAKST